MKTPLHGFTCASPKTFVTKYAGISSATRTNVPIIVTMILGLTLTAHFLSADVFNTTITDVTTRAFSVVWISDEPVTDVDIRVFSDPDGTTELLVDVTVISQTVTGAHDNGIVKIDVTGLAADTTVYAQTETVGASGVILFPNSTPFLEVTTAAETTKVNALNQPIVNDLIRYDAFGVDGATPVPGSIVIVGIPSVSNYPLSVFVGSNGFPNTSAVVDLNNLFDSTGVSAEVPADAVIEIQELRGLNCLGLENHSLRRFGRVPAHEETPAITELESPTSCFSADTICDDTVNVLDVQFVLNSFNSTPGDCAFNPQVNTISDNAINILDVQQVLNHFGDNAPF